MLTCCACGCGPPFVGPRVLLPSCLSFALQLALVMQVPVGSLLPYGSQPSRWGLPYGVEAGLFSIGTKVWYIFFFPFGLFLCDVTALRVIVTIWVRCVGRFTLMRDLRLSLVLHLFSFWMGFKPLSEASLSTPSLQATGWSSLRLRVFGCPWLSPVFFPVPCLGYMSASMTLAPGQPDPEASSDRLSVAVAQSSSLAVAMTSCYCGALGGLSVLVGSLTSPSPERKLGPSCLGHLT